jgi:hypothetical protein
MLSLSFMAGLLLGDGSHDNDAGRLEWYGV